MAVNKSDVRDLRDTDVGDDPLNRAISTANLIRTEDLAGQGHTTARLDEIELYLAAHFSTMFDPEADEIAENSGLQISLSGERGMKLDSTRWGQHAKFLDTSGTLDELDQADAGAVSFSTMTRFEDR